MSMRFAVGLRREGTVTGRLAVVASSRGATGGRHAFAACALAGSVLLGACTPEKTTSGIVAAGHVEATEVHVSSKVPGKIAAVGVQEGDRVKAGQELARIDTTDIELAVALATAEHEQAQAELRLRVAGSRKEDIAQLAAEVEGARADLDGWEKELARMAALLERGSGTTKSRDDARARRDVARARLAASEQALRRARKGSRPEEIDGARARVAGAEARLAQLRQQLADARIASPTAGVVTHRLVEPGEIVAIGGPVCVVTDLDDAWLTIWVGEPDLGRVRLGQAARVATDAGEERKGSVTYVSSEAEFTPKNVQTRDERVKLVFKVKVGLDNKDGLFKPGMPAEARLAESGSGS